MALETSRRDFLSAGAAAGLLTITSKAAHGAANAAPELAAANRYPLKAVYGKNTDIVDFGSGFANLYAYAKAWTTFGDSPVFGGLNGIFYALTGDDMIPLFAYAGYRLNQARIVEPGPDEPVRRLDVRGKEAFLYLDLETGQRLERWKNPFTGETVDVYPWLEEGVCGSMTAERPETAFKADAFTSYRYSGLARGGAAGQAKNIAFDLPWRRVGGNYLGATQSDTRMRNPVTPLGWPKASTGEFVTQHEHLKMFADAKAMDDPDAAHAPWTGSNTRKLAWLPFMLMGRSGIPGGLLALSHCYKITGGIDDVPKPLLGFLEKEHPTQLEPMLSWDHTPPKSGATLHYYAKTVPPETVGYKVQD